MPDLKEQVAKEIFAEVHGDVPWGHTGTCDDESWRRAEQRCLWRASKILGLGLVQLDEDQSLPKNLFDSPARSKSFYDYCNAKRSAFVLGQESLINAGFRKVKEAK